MDFYWHKLNGKLSLPDYAKSERDQMLASVPEGGTVKESLQIVAAPSTNQQKKAFFAMVVSVAQQELNDHGWDVHGVPLCKDQAKKVVYHFCSPRDEDGKIVTLSNASVGEASELFENSCRWLAETFGRVVPQPDPTWRAK